jgi:nucleoside-triphosphatase
VGYEKKFMGILDFWFRGDWTLRKRVLLLTGKPGVGKTTVMVKTVEALKERGVCVGGVVSQEAREGGARVGFEILDLYTGKGGWLAHVNQKTGPRLGKYRVNMVDLDGVGAQAIINAMGRCSVIAIDEVGPMEFFSDKFKAAVRQALESSMLFIAVVHWKADDRLISESKLREDAETFTVTLENRGALPKLLVEKAMEFLRET